MRVNESCRSLGLVYAKILSLVATHLNMKISTISELKITCGQRSISAQERERAGQMVA